MRFHGGCLPNRPARNSNVKFTLRRDVTRWQHFVAVQTLTRRHNMRNFVGVVAVVALVGCGGVENPTGSGGGGGFGGGTAAGGGSGNAGGGSGAVTCNSSNCLGCCFNGACQAGNTAAACGKNGATCSACATAQICKTDQTCGVDADGTWLVQPTTATIAPNNNGSSWDGDGSAPDVIVLMNCDGKASTFSNVTPESSSYSPSWSSGGCTAKARALLADGFIFQVQDSDLTSNDTITGGLRAAMEERFFTAGQVTFSNSGGLQSITFKLTKQ